MMYGFAFCRRADTGDTPVGHEFKLKFIDKELFKIESPPGSFI